MKKVDVNTFIYSLKDELENFATFQLDYGLEHLTKEQWMHRFVNFAGYSEFESSDEDFSEEYEDDFYYSKDLEYEEVVNRRKYRSFRDDDRY